MKRCWVPLLTLASSAALACSDPVLPPHDPASELDTIAVPALIVSNAAAAPAAHSAPGAAPAAASTADVAYVSLPPGTLPDMTGVQIRNVTFGGATLAVALVEGGFDPVPVSATAGDEQELVFTYMDYQTAWSPASQKSGS